MLKPILGRMVLHYFRFFARLQLKKNPRATIIGITGSAGKTSTKHAIVEILKSRGVVKTTEGANSESGIPLDILGLHPKNYSLLDWLRLLILAPIRTLTFKEKYDYYVVEMGIDGPKAPKNMSYLLTIVRPNVGVVLNAGLAHAANFDYLVKDNNPLRREEKLVKLVAREKMKLVKGLSPHGVAVVNIDQKELLRELSEVSSRKITYGKSLKADLRIIDSSISKEGMKLTLSYQGIVYKLATKDPLGEAYLSTFAAAISACCALGIPPSLSIKQLANYRSPAGRMRIFPGIRNSVLIDSSYNASPITMLESLKLLKKIGGKHKKIAVLGDMNELGISSKLAHKDLADYLLRYADEAVLYGHSVKEFTLPVLRSKKFPVKHFDRMTDLIIYLESRVKSQNYVLFKGSQNGIYLERAIERLLAEKTDRQWLCRRGKYWDNLRTQTP